MGPRRAGGAHSREPFLHLQGCQVPAARRQTGGPAAKPDDPRSNKLELAAAQQARWEAEAAGLAEAERRGLAGMAAAARAASTGQERRAPSTGQAPRAAPAGHGFPYSGPGAGFPVLFGLRLGAA